MVTNCSDKLLIFDCDGTLVDSEMLCNTAMETCLERVGIVESAPSLLARYRGAKLSGILADIADRHARVLPTGFTESYRDEVSRLFTRHLKPTEGVAEALVQLPNPRCVASSGPVAKICQALEVTGLARHFGDHIYSAYEVKRWKPDPGLFLEAARAEKFQSSECIIVEDSLLGVEAAKRAGMTFLLYDPDDRYEAVSMLGGMRFSRGTVNVRLQPSWQGVQASTPAADNLIALDRSCRPGAAVGRGQLWGRLAQFSTNWKHMKSEIHRLLAAAWLFLACGISTAADDVEISLAHGGAAETEVETRLRSLLSRYDLSPWTVTRRVVIDQDEIPHSHPVLTLHARHRNDDELLLSTYVHEQLHWWLGTRPKEMAEAEAELRLRYPRIPVGYPTGSSDDDGNYEHLLVIYLEYRADQTLLGELKAREVMQFWASDHYTWLYEKVLSEPDVIGRVVKKYGLSPPRA